MSTTNTSSANRFRFRAWDKETHVMDYLEELTYYTLNDGGCILMQSTGLLDVDGKEVYEGDIIKGTSYRYGYELDNGKQFDYLGYVGWLGTEHQKFVVHDADTFQIVFGTGKNPPIGSAWDLANCVHRNTIDYITGRVIGNIYENPELFK